MNKPAQPQQPGQTGQDDKTFNTDISESDEEGTTVREAEVREDDMSEVKPSSPQSPSGQ
jgi:hypothetical protein